MGVTISNSNAALKLHYAENLVRSQSLDPKQTAFMGLVSKREGKMIKGPQGYTFVVPIKTRDLPSANYSFTKAQTKSQSATGQSAYTAFQVTVTENYAVGNVDGKAAAVTENGEDAFVDLAKEECDSSLRTVRRDLAEMCFKTGTGSRGTISARTATSVTLTNASDAFRYEIGMDLVAAAADGTGALRSATTCTVTAVNPDTGVLTLSGGDPTALGWTANDFLYVDGEFVASTKTKILGLDFWIPQTAPSAGTDASGADRSTTWKLNGLRYNAASSSNFRDALIDASARVVAARGKTTHAFCNPIDFAKVQKSGEALKAIRETNEYGVSFDGVQVMGYGGAFSLLPDMTVPQGKAWLLNMDHVFFIHAGQALAFLDEKDGAILSRMATADQYECRAKSYSNLVVDDPSTQLIIYGIT